MIGESIEKVQETTQSADKFGRVVKLHGFKPFTSAANALEQVNCVSRCVRAGGFAKLFRAKFAKGEGFEKGQVSARCVRSQARKLYRGRVEHSVRV